MTAEEIIKLYQGRHPSWTRAHIRPQPPKPPRREPPRVLAAFLSGLLVGLLASAAAWGWTL